MRPDPQYGVPLSVADIPLELPISPIYGVTQFNKYIPIQVDNDGKLSIGNVTITGPITVNDVVIKGVDPANGNTSQDVAVNNLGSGNGFALRTSLFDGVNKLIVNSDGSINVDATGSGSIPVTIDHALDSVAIYGTDGTTDQFIKTDLNGNLQVGVINTTLAITQSTSPWVISGTATVSGTVTANQGSANSTPWNENIAQIAGSTIAVAATGIAKVGLTDGSGNAITSTSSALDVNIKNDTYGVASSAVTSVARSNVNQTFLVANTSRKGATLYNDSAVNLFVKLGATASSSDFTVRLSAQDYYEVPFRYTGRIDGIWATNGAGDARITELT